jgi:hypothetical protein
VILLVAGMFNQMFAYRYIYFVFLPLVVLAAAAFSKIRFKWIIFIVYLVAVSNFVFPIAYVSVLKPESTISYVDFTAPQADFRQTYDDLRGIYNNETLIVTFTPAAEWYFKKPDYWIRISFTGLNDSWQIYQGKEVYTGAEIIYDFDGFKRVVNGSIIVLDDWGASRLSRDIFDYINENCEKIISKNAISAFKCGS